MGDYDQDLAKLNLSDRQVPVVVRLNDAAREDLETLRRLPVPGARGSVPLESVATLQIESGPSEITRYDRMRNVNLEVELNGLPLSDIEETAEALPSLQNLPRGVVLTSAGDAEVMAELVVGFSLAMLTGVLCIYSVLVLLLKDFAQPITVLAALVLSIPGAFLALFLTSSGLSMPSMIGLIMLMGIVTKNAILLIDYIIIARRDHQLERWDAIVDACRKRARPIVMTTICCDDSHVMDSQCINRQPDPRKMVRQRPSTPPVSGTVRLRCDFMADSAANRIEGFCNPRRRHSTLG